jgi:hypothetical protein
MPKDKPEREYTDLDKLLARAKDFEVGGHKYKVLPLLIEDALEYAETWLWGYDPQRLLSFNDGLPLFVKWLEKAARTATGEVVTLETIKADKWSTADMQDYLKTLAGVSG